MKTFKIIISEDETITATIPETWNEITVAQFVRLETDRWDGKDAIQLLGILSGVNVKKLDNLEGKQATKLYDVLTEALAFVAGDPPDFEALSIKNKFNLNGRDLDVPNDLEMERIGQKILLANLMQNDNMTKQIPQALAIYFQPIYDKVEKFDRKRIPVIVDHINRTPIIEAYPIVSFFFQKLTNLKRNGTTL